LCIGRAIKAIFRAKLKILLPRRTLGVSLVVDVPLRAIKRERCGAAVCNQKNAVGRKIHTVESMYTSSTSRLEVDPGNWWMGRNQNVAHKKTSQRD